MAQIRLTPNEAILYVTLLNIGIGIILGAIPLILGFLRKKRKYAMFGFIGSVIGGAILGILLSIPIAGIFTWLVLKKDEEEIVADEETIDSEDIVVDEETVNNDEIIIEEPIDISAENSEEL